MQAKGVIINIETPWQNRSQVVCNGDIEFFPFEIPYVRFLAPPGGDINRTPRYSIKTYKTELEAARLMGTYEVLSQPIAAWPLSSSKEPPGGCSSMPSPP